MTKNEFKKNEYWALRTKRRGNAARVKLLLMVDRHYKTRVKVRHMDGELEGLEEFVSGHHLICRWAVWPRVVKDEKAEADLIELLKTEEPVTDPVYDATESILEASGETSGHLVHGRNLFVYATSHELERIATRAHLKERPWLTKPCFAHRDGHIAVPCRIMVDLAIAFAAAEPELVNLYLDHHESMEVAESLRPGREHRISEVIRNKPSYAIARQWARGNNERDFLRREIQRLRGLVFEAAAMLRAADRPRDAQTLEVGGVLILRSRN